jgi:hypothetical protein
VGMREEEEVRKRTSSSSLPNNPQLCHPEQSEGSHNLNLKHIINNKTNQLLIIKKNKKSWLK